MSMKILATSDWHLGIRVIDSLAMLQSSQGKKVGVISHTEIYP